MFGYFNFRSHSTSKFFFLLKFSGITVCTVCALCIVWPPQVLRLEHDAGSEFRGKIRVLERQKADLEGRVDGLEGQLRTSKEHSEQYQSMSQAYEQQLQESNDTHAHFKWVLFDLHCAMKVINMQWKYCLWCCIVLLIIMCAVCCAPSWSDCLWAKEVVSVEVIS